MKKDLTDKQKEIVKLIEDQFMALNESSKEVPFNFINISKIQGEANRIKVGTQNLSIANEAVKALRNELVEKLVKQFNQDFERGNMPLDAKVSGFGGSVDFNGYNLKYSCDQHFYLEVRPKQKNTEFGTEHLPEFEFAESCISKEKFDSVEAFINSDTIQKRLLKLYQYITQRYPECQR
jgi:hypothetical protein